MKLTEKLYQKDYFETILSESVLNYEDVNDWYYEYENQNVSLMFSKDESGTNSVEEFCVKINGNWTSIEPMQWQIDLMFSKLGDTEPMEIEVEYAGNSMGLEDHYNEKGLSPWDFF
jgi:hypothetical protein